MRAADPTPQSTVTGRWQALAGVNRDAASSGRSRRRATWLTFVNRVLCRLGFRLQPVGPEGLDADTANRFARQLETARREAGAWTVREELRDDSRPHPVSYIDFECEFASAEIARIDPDRIFDIGSYRHWLLGVMSGRRAITLDVRERETRLANETAITADVRDMDLPDETFDMVVSLHTIEHFGLGRYGDPFDMEGCRKGIGQIIRVLRPGGRLVFSVPVTRGAPCVAFNSHRIFTRDLIWEWFAPLLPEREAFIKKRPGRWCAWEEVTDEPGNWDVYIGCYRKPGAPS
jgi:SAM-dependent methyltransferase